MEEWLKQLQQKVNTLAISSVAIHKTEKRLREPEN
jgi:hypothetical protein